MPDIKIKMTCIESSLKYKYFAGLQLEGHLESKIYQHTKIFLQTSYLILQIKS